MCQSVLVAFTTDHFSKTLKLHMSQETATAQQNYRLHQQFN